MSKFIVIEGLIGVGKTSLCRLLEKEWKARLVLEPCEDNPFLQSFYDNPGRYAFPTQMFYLASRYAQQMALHQPDLFSELTVSDYLFAKDRLFAEQTLDEDELKLYDRFAGLLKGSLVPPDFILFLDAPTEVIQKRIERRAIESEQVIQASYLDSLREAYYELWDRTDTPVYVVNTAGLNYVDDYGDAQRMMAMIRGWLDGDPLPMAPTPYERQEKQLKLFG